MYLDNNKLMCEKDEQCCSCKFALDARCTLLQLISLGYLDIIDDFIIDNCIFYKKIMDISEKKGKVINIKDYLDGDKGA